MINSISVGKNNISDLSQQKIDIENKIFSMKEEIRNCTTCEHYYNLEISKITKINQNKELRNSEIWNQYQDLYIKICDWEKVITCSDHKSIGGEIKLKIKQVKYLQFLIKCIIA